MEIKNIYLPGKQEVDYREYRYFRLIDVDINQDNFVNKVAGAYEPLIPQTGGVLSENFIVITPQNEKFYGLSYSKDIIGWRKQIENGAKILSLKIAKIENGEYFKIEDGDRFKLKDCLFERYNFYDDQGNLVKQNTPVEKDEIF